ncbi:CHASE2 domain-containing protein [Trichothermofontia sp.]
MPLQMWQRLRQGLWEWRGVWVVAPSVTVLVLGLRFTGILQGGEWAAYDQYLRWRPAPARDDRIVIVGINEDDVRALGQAIIPDAIYAQVLRKLLAQNPHLIALDVYRDQPVEPGHQELVQVFESHTNIIGIEKMVGDRSREAVAAPPALQAKGQVAFNDLLFDRDRVVRRALLTLQDRSDETVLSVGTYAALAYLATVGLRPELVAGQDYWQIGPTPFPPLETNDGGYVRVDAQGYQLLLNYRGPTPQFAVVSLTDVLADRIPADWASDRIVLIGAVSESFQDLFLTPFTRTPSQRMPGVEIHASLASQILSAVLDDRPLIKTWPEAVEGLWIALWATIGAILTWTQRYAGGVRSVSWQKGGSILLASVVLVGSSYLLFLAAWWVPIVPAALAFGGAAIAITAYIARTAGDIRQTFGRYLSDEIVANLLEHPEGLKLGGQRRTITLLTSDLRGFTALSERLPPEEVVRVLNFYLEAMADIITDYGGTIDEFMGDGILVLFGAPTQREDDAARAIACAIAMQQAMPRINQQMAAWGLPPLAMGIGINTGEVVVGNIGSTKRTKYGVVGSQVNLTYRIESYTTGGQILISESTLRCVPDRLRLDGQKQVQPKGVKDPIYIYEVGGIGGDYQRFLPEKIEEVFCPLPQPLALRYTLLEGKHVGENQFLGQLVKLSAMGAEIQANPLDTDGIPIALSNIKLNLLDPDTNQPGDDIYAKVLEKMAPLGHYYVHFTAQPPEIAQYFQTLHRSCQSSNP